MDVGLYPIQLCQWIYQQPPTSINATGKLNSDGVDMEMNAVINYGDNRVCKIRTSAFKTLENAATIIGSKGKITVSSMNLLCHCVFDKFFDLVDCLLTDAIILDHRNGH